MSSGRRTDHDQSRLREATDQAITSASRNAPPGRARVTVADVRQRAQEDFGMQIDEASARRILRDRLAYRGRGRHRHRRMRE